MELFALQPYAGKRVCVALSGGRDSVALLHFFYLHAAEYGITWQVSVDGVERPDFKLDFDLASGVLEVIPEPSAFGLLVGALALALAVSRRRRA